MKSPKNFKKMPIGNLFNFPETNSKITKKFCINHKGTIPVYASSSNEKSTLGLIEDNLPNIKYYEDCLSWNRNGSVGYVFLRNHRFTTNEDHRALIIKSQYQNKLDKTYLKFEIERQLFINGFSYLNKCGVDKISEVEILIPINREGEFDLEKQKKLADKYIKIDKIKSELTHFFNEIINFHVNISSKYNVKKIPITKIFKVIKGNSKYTKKYLHEHKGEYPLYSSKTKDSGEIGRIDTYDYEKKCFTWTTDGVYAGTVFFRNEKFSITTHCGILDLKEKFDNEVDFDYLKFILRQKLPTKTLGEGANKRLGVERMSEIFIELPINKTNKFDLNKQKEIAIKYRKISAIKEKIEEDFEKIMNGKVQII